MVFCQAEKRLGKPGIDELLSILQLIGKDAIGGDASIAECVVTALGESGQTQPLIDVLQDGHFYLSVRRVAVSGLGQPGKHSSGLELGGVHPGSGMQTLR